MVSTIDKLSEQGYVVVSWLANATCSYRYMTEYDPAKPSSFLLYLDATNLYGWAMSQALPVSNFSWVSSVMVCM